MNQSIKLYLFGSLSKDRTSSEIMPCSAPSIGILEAFEPVAINIFFTCSRCILEILVR